MRPQLQRFDVLARCSGLAPYLFISLTVFSNLLIRDCKIRQGVLRESVNYTVWVKLFDVSCSGSLWEGEGPLLR